MARATVVKGMPLGDSITQGWEDEAGPAATLVGYRLPLWDLFAANSAANGYTMDFVGPESSGTTALPDHDHAGFGGYAIDQIDAIIAAHLVTYQPDVILLLAGTNDLWVFETAATALARMRLLLTTIHGAAPRALTVLCSPPAIGPGAPYADREVERAAFAAALPALVAERRSARQEITLIDGSDLERWDVIGHLTAAGYTTLAQRYYAAAVAMLAMDRSVAPGARLLGMVG